MGTITIAKKPKGVRTGLALTHTGSSFGHDETLKAEMPFFIREKVNVTSNPISNITLKLFKGTKELKSIVVKTPPKVIDKVVHYKIDLNGIAKEQKIYFVQIDKIEVTIEINDSSVVQKSKKIESKIKHNRKLKNDVWQKKVKNGYHNITTKEFKALNIILLKQTHLEKHPPVYIKMVQIALQQLGYSVTSDGAYGPGGQHILEQFHKEYKIKDDEKYTKNYVPEFDNGSQICVNTVFAIDEALEAKWKAKFDASYCDLDIDGFTTAYQLYMGEKEIKERVLDKTTGKLKTVKKKVDDFKKLSSTQVSTLKFLLEEIQKNYSGQRKKAELKHIVYMLATVRKEAGDGFLYTTIEKSDNTGDKYFELKYDPELGKEKKDRDKAKKYGNTTKGDGVKYRGRGLVQLTYKANYEKMGQRLNIDLVEKPELSITQKNAVAIMIYGMTNGTLTGVKLSTYLTSSKTDYKGARAIINGSDKADLVAEFAKNIESYLKFK